MTTKRASAAPDFEKSFTELEAIAEKFERGEYSLEEGLEAFERGAKIAQALKKRLATIEQRVEKIRADYDLTEEDSDDSA